VEVYSGRGHLTDRTFQYRSCSGGVRYWLGSGALLDVVELSQSRRHHRGLDRRMWSALNLSHPESPQNGSTLGYQGVISAVRRTCQSKPGEMLSYAVAETYARVRNQQQ
jgi:hypothetical protein